LNWNTPGRGRRTKKNWLRPSGGGLTDKFLASNDRRTYRAEVEEQNPLRAVIKISGTHATEDGKTFGPYSMKDNCLRGEFPP